MQGAYLNAALRLDSELSPEELLRRLLEVEREQGRERRERWGPRTLDSGRAVGAWPGAPGTGPGCCRTPA